jgi:hypothetical protein
MPFIYSNETGLFCRPENYHPAKKGPLSEDYGFLVMIYIFLWRHILNPDPGFKYRI